ncbi:hypothetical protein Rsub_04437 [Raphidocelis subcapitata]|uniref:SET domain-containing protein n=1 Tax=Raphidocelis subcapitata TaxID=307507 RepID=A0A2V0P2M0_9CHLO|nr:hypothetical protein Rsub_04437 [Raphidocelis subcapitata]|eukprot:GBF92090.1 hypothetical protein Rsub_04437 [Raphidocelis subcapitata]
MALLPRVLLAALRRAQPPRPHAAAAAAAAALSAPPPPPLARAFASVPDGVKAVFEGAPFAAALVPGAGRGLVASEPIGAGSRILREAPLVAVPSIQARSKVCYECLSPFRHPASEGAAAAGSSAESGGGGGGPIAVPLPGGRGDALFCGPACLSRARASFFEAECAPGASAGLAALDALCSERGERFPLMAARLALAALQRAASSAGDGGGSGSGGSGGSGSSSSGGGSGGGQGCGEELQREQSAPGAPGPALGDLSFLCFANVGPHPPEAWREAFEPLSAALAGAAAAYGGGSGSSSSSTGSSGGSGQGSAAAEALARLDLAWFCAAMARLHLNTFRVDCVLPLSFNPDANFADLAALAVASLGAESSSGSAAYLVASLLNHSCEPNVDAVFTAARDISPGEELSITYTDWSQGVQERRAHLRASYGFECGCPLCLEQLEAAGARGQSGGGAGAGGGAEAKPLPTGE